MSEQAIVPRNGGGALASTSSGLEGFEGFTNADLQIPIIKIVQGVSRMELAEKHVGEWWNSVTGEFSESLDVVVLHMKHSRALFDKDSEKPECVSRDIITGSTYGSCASCDFNAHLHQELWGEQVKRCDLGYSLLCYLPDQDMPALYTAARSNVKVMKGFTTAIKTRKVPTFGVLVTFGTKLVIEPTKRWFVVAPKIKQVFDSATIQSYREMARSLLNTSYEVVDEEPAEAEIVEDLNNFSGTTTEYAERVEAIHQQKAPF